MSALAASQIYGYARGAGFSPSQAVIATAIALAESGGNPASHCLNCLGVTEDSRGLWQINVDAHPQMAGQNLYDPATNAKAAYQVSNGGQNFRPWSTYTSGAYSSHLGAANAAAGSPAITGPAQGGMIGGPTQSGITGGPGLVPNIGGGVAGALGLGNLGDDLKNFAIRFGVLIVGSALVVVGLYRSVQPAVQKVANVAGDAVKAGAA